MEVTMMEPMLPEGAALPPLEDSALRLVEAASGLAKRIHPTLQHSVGDLVRSMNCHYSNLMEGHDTHPRDIERALAGDFSSEPKKRDLQLEAVAHIHVQNMIDEGRDPEVWPATAAYARWLHKEFCERLPDDLLWLENKSTGERHKVVPGRFRRVDVEVGRHLPPSGADVPRFLARFDRAYGSPPLSRLRQIMSVGAVHHRFLWIHPFLDGNGRVARLMSHALLKRLGIGTRLWSVARGLAREEAEYKRLLEAADHLDTGDLDGRENLTRSGLLSFCRFFLERSIDQVAFMEGLLDPSEFLRRMEIHIEEEVGARRLERGSFMVLREAALAGQVERARIPMLTNYEERAARKVTSALMKRGMLMAPNHRAPLRLAFPTDAVERWFPLLYPNTPGGAP